MSRSTVRHIPEDELHAYLDQALSRSQCVEIERHLARCSGCQTQRDSIAALRDRTTALLARIGPPPIVPPAFGTLLARAASRQQRRWRWLRAGAWAAGVGGTLLLGWSINGRVFRVEPKTTVAATTPTVASTPDAPRTEKVPGPAAAREAKAVTRKPKPRPIPHLVRATRPAADSTPETTGFALAQETDPRASFDTEPEQLTLGGTTPLELNDFVAQPVGADPGLNGLWRTIVPDTEAKGHRADIALVPGLPVVQMRVQPGTPGGDVTAVDQMLDAGDMIRTISGPAERVLSLVNEDAAADSTATLRMASGSRDRMTVTIRQGDRMVAVTGPAQALGSLLARVNIKNAKKRY
jgi:hypothetical protein